MTIINILFIASPNKYIESVNNWTEVFIFAKNVTLVASLFPFLAFKSLRAPTQISLVITREIWVGALRDLNARNGKSDATKVTFLAKIKTSVQLLTLSIYLFGLVINNMLIIIIADILLFISLFITLYTGFIYTLNTFKKNEELQ